MSEDSTPPYVLSRRNLLKRLGALSAGLYFASRFNAMDAALAAEQTAPALAANLTPLFSTSARLGIANTAVRNGYDYAMRVFRFSNDPEENLPIPIYIQQLVRSEENYDNGHLAGYEIKGTNTNENAPEKTRKRYIKQISAHNHKFGRRNIVDNDPANSRPNLLADIGTRTDEVYYFYNEPEASVRNYSNVTPPTPPGNIFGWGRVCTGVHETDHAQDADAVANGGVSNWWDALTRTENTYYDPQDPTCPPAGTPQSYTYRRIRAATLAKLYLRYRAIVAGENPNYPQSQGRRHRLLLPSAINPDWDFVSSQADLDAANPSLPGSYNGFGYKYWGNFFYWLRQGFGTPAGISPNETQKLYALHSHFYPYFPSKNETVNGAIFEGYDPLKPTATALVNIAKGAFSFRAVFDPNRGTAMVPAGSTPDNYNPPAANVDYILSETGPNWEAIVKLKKGKFKEINCDKIQRSAQTIWTAGYPDMRAGLSFWNTYLYWITQRAKQDIKITGNVYAMIHTAHEAPHAYRVETPVRNPNDPATTWVAETYTRSQHRLRIVDNNTLQPDLYQYAPTVQCLRLGDLTNGHNNRWTALEENRVIIDTDESYWLTPLGISYSVWSRLANDQTTGNFGTGWQISNAGTAGSLGTTTLTIEERPANASKYITVYIPVIKRRLVGSPTPDQNAHYRLLFYWKIGTSSYTSYGQIMLGPTHMADPKAYQGTVYTGASCDGSAITDPDIRPWRNQNPFLESATLVPVVLYRESLAEFNITLQIMREHLTGGNEVDVIVGRPIVYPGLLLTWDYLQ